MAALVVMVFILSSCSQKSGSPLPGAPIGAPLSSGNLTEVSPPIAIQELSRALEGYQPQLSITSPRPDEVIEDEHVLVRFNLRDLPTFKNEQLGLGPHLHVIVDDLPYQAVYDPSQPLELDLAPGTHTIRAFASRPWHESFKNEGAYAQTTFHIYTKTRTNAPSSSKPLLTYSRPQGSYGAEPILLDFYLTNAPLHLVAAADAEDDIADWRIRCTINGQNFVLDRWQPLYLKGFKPGKNWVQLEFLDEKGNPVENVFNNTVRVITYKPGGQDALSRLVRGELSAAESRSIVDPNAQPAPALTPAPIPTSAPPVPSVPSPEPTAAPTPIPEATPAPTPAPAIDVPATAPVEILEEPQPELAPVPTPAKPNFFNRLRQGLKTAPSEAPPENKIVAPVVPAPEVTPLVEVSPEPEPSAPAPIELPSEEFKSPVPEMTPVPAPTVSAPPPAKPNFLDRLRQRSQAARPVPKPVEPKPAEPADQAPIPTPPAPASTSSDPPVLEQLEEEQPEKAPVSDSVETSEPTPVEAQPVQPAPKVTPQVPRIPSRYLERLPKAERRFDQRPVEPKSLEVPETLEAPEVSVPAEAPTLAE
ncbi:hypothetical protein [Leptolyngbya sp. FACHB-261]|uniref:hypothetical protein n=1 Tax=Leptolyngbya sp. FACHB-261 TaxID=2692806 RepID=UPI001684AD07|nr:hypothetical protein [Leptolyngbya sp. FACHB-261]MBD2102384.1 hypothetical protein [Leptolyngbya sp. FACHB-261]